MRGISRLAHELGLSTGTVSRALNDKPGVNGRTRQLVLEAAQRLGYQPNQAARTLASGRTGAIGFMFEVYPEVAVIGDNFYLGVIDGVQSVLAAHGLDLLVLPCPGRQPRLAYLDRWVARGLVDGMILSNTDRIDPHIDLLQSAGLPFVTLGRSQSSRDFAWVDLDFEHVAEASIDRLVAGGHRRIAVTVPFGELNHGYVFVEAYRRSLKKRGIAFDPELVFRTGLGVEDGYLIVDELLDRPDPATAILLIYETAAVGIYRRLAERGLRPGADLAVIGLRDEAVIHYVTPRLTCFELSLFETGATLAEAILAQLAPRAEDEGPRLMQVKMPMRIRPGESDPPLAIARQSGPRKRQKASTHSRPVQRVPVAPAG
jgi:DNA-binding LacI/PurR family transcriptional regulator